MTTASHQTTATSALAPLRTGRFDSHLANLLKRQLEKFPRHCRALHVLVSSDLCGNAICLLRIYYAVGVIFRPQVPLQAKNGQRQRAFRLERRADFFDPLLGGLQLVR